MRLLLDKAIISVQNPITIKPLSEPEPDICILKLRDNYYENSHPKGEDVLLLIEVSDTTLQKDKTVKADLYANIFRTFGAKILSFCVTSVSY